MKIDRSKDRSLEDFLFNKSDLSDPTGKPIPKDNMLLNDGKRSERRFTEESSEKAKPPNTENSAHAEIREMIKSEMSKALQELQRASRYTEVRRWRKRKNQRVVYLRKDPVIQGVLDRMQGSPDEPLRVTVGKVFEVAAKHLNFGRKEENV